MLRLLKSHLINVFLNNSIQYYKNHNEFPKINYNYIFNNIYKFYITNLLLKTQIFIFHID